MFYSQRYIKHFFLNQIWCNLFLICINLILSNFFNVLTHQNTHLNSIMYVGSWPRSWSPIILEGDWREASRKLHECLNGGMGHRKVLLSFEIAIWSRQFIILFIFVLFERNQTQMCCHRSVIRLVGLVIVEASRPLSLEPGPCPNALSG